MKIKVITSILLGIFIVLLSTVAFAATGTVELKSNVSEIKKGETFKVTLSATSQDGINGIDAKYNYDSEKLELVNEKVVNTTNWSNIGSANNITIPRSQNKFFPMNMNLLYTENILKISIKKLQIMKMREWPLD